MRIERSAAIWIGGLVCLAAALAPTPAAAEGTQTGVIAGLVVDSTGVGLEGVEVALTGPRTLRTALTDGAGRFRFPSLGPGTYRVRAELLGLASPDTPVEVYIGKTSEARLELGAAPAEAAPVSGEWIQVVAEAPVIDKFDPRIGASVGFDLLDELPVARAYQSAARLLPGVGGGADGNPTVSGALRSSNLFLVDGVDTTDPTTGLFGLNLAYEAVAEVDVTTAVAGAEYGRSSGAVINVVTRSGSNRLEGAARWVGTNPDWNEPYDFPPAQVAHLGPELAAANAGPDDIDQTFALSVGGPLALDRLWFYAAFENVESTFLGPTVAGPLWDEGVELEAGAAKLTWRATAGSTLIAQYTSDDAAFAAFTPFDRGPSENRIGPTPDPLAGSLVARIPGDLFALEDRTQEGRFAKLGYTAAFGQNLALELTLAEQERELTRDTLNSRGLTADAPHVAVIAFLREGEEEVRIREVILFNGITDRGFERRPRSQGNLALRGFFTTGRADHELKAGIDYQRTRSERRFNVPGRRGIDPATGRPVEGQMFIDLDVRPGCLSGEVCPPFDPQSGAFRPFQLLSFWQRPVRETREEIGALYLEDSIAWGPVVLRLGARYETLRGETAAGRRLVEDDAVAPRASLTFDPWGDGKTLFTAAWGRYLEPFLQQYLDSFGLFETFSGFTEYIWAHGVPFCDAADPADIDSPCWFPTGAVDLSLVQRAQADPDLERTRVDEWVVGFERQLTPTTGLSLHYLRREWDRLWDNVIELRGGDAENPVLASTVRNLEVAERRHQALQLLVQKRFAGRWALLGSYTWSETEGNLFTADGFSDFADFAQVSDTNLVNRFGPAPYDRTHQARLFGHYRIPYERISLSLGSALRYESGVPFELRVGDPFGVRFVTPRGSERLPEVLQWDLALGADFRLGSELVLETKAEVFNVTDAGEVLGVESLLEAGFGLPRSIVDLQAPRSYRLTLGLRF